MRKLYMSAESESLFKKLKLHFETQLIVFPKFEK